MSFKNIAFAAIFTALLAGFAPSAANAAYVPSWLSEVKLGLMSHDSYTFEDKAGQFWKNRIEKGMDVQLALLIHGPDFFSYIGSPRIQLGGNLSTAGETNHAFADLYWNYDFESGPFIAGFFGLAIHDGKLNISQTDSNGNITPESQRRFDNTKKFGSRVLFHFGPEIGYRIDEHHSLALYWSHISNGKILTSDKDDPNQGQDNVGLRYGYAF